MEKRVYDSEYFSAEDTLGCGQLFRFYPSGGGFIVFSADKACFLKTNGAVTEVCSDDADYFENYFDADKDYSAIVSSAKDAGNRFLSAAAECGKGIRILRQNREEVLFSFVVSQNNNIPRIKGIIERLCAELGEERTFDGKIYHSFPKAARIAQKQADFYRGIGLGYRAEYFPAVADALLNGFDLDEAAKLPTPELKKELIKLKGVGPKVADCVALFGFNRSDSFPVDTWMEKIYREDFGGTLTDRNKIAEYFTGAYGEAAGFFQQYMFHYKRNVENVR
ncbi:MAG: hypothetical protein IJU84_02745 [Clostridia bacterium]|nr:hypothetical protein [Clostridia bacterium]